MEDIQVTIVVVPRERFSYTERSLQSIYEHTTFPFRLVYVSAGAPSRIKQFLVRESQHKNFRLISKDHYLAPNEARNLGLREVETKYVVFMDNDALVTPGWLEALVRCAEETGAWVVGPLYLIGEIKIEKIDEAYIHMAGGVAHIEEEHGKRILYDEHLLVDTPLAEQRKQIKRGQRDYVEFHCMLVRTDVFERLGEIDEQLLSVNEHIDFCFEVRKAGGSVYLESEALTSYVPPPLCCDWRDLPYFMLRWSEAWNQASASHFNRKHGFSGVRYFGDRSNLDEDTIVKFGRGQRRLLTGMQIIAQDISDGPQSPIEEAELMLAMLQTVDRDAFDVTLATPDCKLEHIPALDPRALMRRLPAILNQSDDCMIMIRPRGQSRPNQPAILRIDDLDMEGLARLQAYAFLVLETGVRRYQCWLAIVGRASNAAAARMFSTTTRATGAAVTDDALLAGSRIINRETGEPEVGCPRVRLVSAHAGLLNTMAQLESKGVMPYLWAGRVC